MGAKLGLGSGLQRRRLLDHKIGSARNWQSAIGIANALQLGGDTARQPFRPPKHLSAAGADALMPSKRTKEPSTWLSGNEPGRVRVALHRGS